MQKRKLEMADLYEPPLTSFGTDAVERWFSEGEMKELINFTSELVV
jgi:type I restriction enzyme R subunit